MENSAPALCPIPVRALLGICLAPDKPPTKLKIHLCTLFRDRYTFLLVVFFYLIFIWDVRSILELCFRKTQEERDKEEEAMGRALDDDGLVITRERQFFTRTIVSSLVVLTTMLIPITKRFAMLFRCSEDVVPPPPGYSNHLWKYDSTMRCWSSEHLHVVAGFGLIGLFYVAGIPVLMVYLVKVNAATLNSALTKERIGFLYSPYRRESVHFQAVMYLRLIALAFISVILQDNPDLQAGMGMAILFAAALVQVIYHPYASLALNRFEDFSLLAAWATLYIGTLLYDPRGWMQSSWVRTLLMLLVVLIQLMFLVVLAHSLGLLWFWKPPLPKQEKKATPTASSSKLQTNRAKTHVRTPSGFMELEMNPMHGALALGIGIRQPPRRPVSLKQARKPMAIGDPRRARSFVPAGAFWKRDGNGTKTIREQQKAEAAAATDMRNKISS